MSAVAGTCQRCPRGGYLVLVDTIITDHNEWLCGECANRYGPNAPFDPIVAAKYNARMSAKRVQISDKETVPKAPTP